MEHSKACARSTDVTTSGPTYFRSIGEDLFSFFHGSKIAQSKGGVLLCPPLGHEYMRAHWALRRLAELLSNRGRDVLRFDYFGTGDSQGELHDGNPAKWIQNIVDARDVLARRCGVSRIDVVGLRLGALLAAKAVELGMSCSSLVLWDPVEDGARYLTDIEELTRRRREFLLSRSVNRSHPHEKYFGFDLSEGTEAAVKTLKLPNIASLTCRSLMFTTSTSQHLCFPTSEYIYDAGDWSDEAHAEHALLTPEVLKKISSELS